MKKNYVVRKYSNGGCYDSGCFSSITAAKRFVAGAPRATITECDDPYYGDNWSGWHAEGNCKDIPTGRKCDICE